MQETKRHYIPPICYWGSMKKCSIECDETFFSSTLLDALNDSLVSWGIEVRRIFNVVETHDEYRDSQT
jgi:hypothetical protein